MMRNFIKGKKMFRGTLVKPWNTDEGYAVLIDV